MAVLRELIAKFGMQVDEAGFKRANAGVQGLLGALRGAGAQADATAAKVDAAQKRTADAQSGAGAMLAKLGQIAVTVGISHLVKSMVELASSAGEIQNVLQASFGDAGVRHVNEWADKTADAMGRSRFELMNFVSQLAVVLGPMASTSERAREMSERMAELGVDLASFVEGTTDAEALHALRSGLTGEIESLKRFGVNLNEANMAEQARIMGIKKKIAAMTTAEKTEVRYAAILRLSKAAHGDAARSVETFAGATKRLRGQMIDLGTVMGQTVLPYVVRVMSAVSKAASGFVALARDSYILQAAMGVLSTVAGVMAFNMLSAFILPAVALVGLVWAVDQLMATFRGGRSDIKDWLDAWQGAGTTAKLVNEIREAVDALVNSIKALTGNRGALNWLAINRKDTAIGKWAQREVMERDSLSDERDARARRTHYGVISPQVRPDPYAQTRVVPEDYTVLPWQDSVDERRKERERAERDRARRPAVAAGAPYYSTLPGDAADEANYARPPRVTAPALPPYFVGAGAAPPASLTPGAAAPVSVTNHTTIAIHGGDTQQVRRVVEDVLSARDERTLSSLPDQP